MKLNKSYILALGVIGSPLLTISANADTIYMCKACKSGTYANNGKCESCPAGSYCIDGVKHPCEAGHVTTGDGSSFCVRCEIGTYANSNNTSCISCPSDSVCINGTRRILEWEWFDSSSMTVKECKEAGVSVQYNTNINCGGGSNICDNFYKKGGCENNKDNYTYQGDNKVLFSHSGVLTNGINSNQVKNQEAVCDKNTGEISYSYF